jgi:predicted transcriptional regulator YdeE
MALPYRKLINSYIVGIAEQVSNTEIAKISRLWDRFHKEGISDKIPFKVSGGIYCVYYNYESDHNGKFKMLIGHEVKMPMDVYSGLEAVQIPDYKYSMYHSIGRQPEALITTWNDIWGDVNLDRAFAVDFDFYPADNPQHVITFVSVKKPQ